MTMKKATLWFVLLLTIISSASAIDFFSNRMNYPPGTSRIHAQELYLSGNLTITIPPGFNVTYVSENGTINSNVTFSNIVGTSKFNMTSPSLCNDGTIVRSEIFQNNIKQGEFRFLCIPDDKVVDYKVEYGHGEGNYLDNSELFIPIDEATLFNLIRLFPLSHVLSPNPDIENATIECNFPNKPIRTFGRVEIQHDFDNNQVNGSFAWPLIDSGFWFRIGVVSQDTINYSVGDLYNVSCTELVYSLGTHEVRAPFTNQSIRFVTKTPYIFTAINDTANPGNIIVAVTNNESYITREVEFVFKKANDTSNIMIPQINPGETFFFRVPATREVNLSAFFIPPWFHNSFEDDIYVQQDGRVAINSPPILGALPVCRLFINETFSQIIPASDPDGDTITFADNTTLFQINSSSGQIIFLHNGTPLGNISININVTDPFNAVDSGTLICELLNTTNTTTPTNSTNTTNTTTTNTTTPGGGGKPFGKGTFSGSGGGTSPTCNENWDCNQWSQCSATYDQTRTCVDRNACGTIYNRPSTIKDCIPEGMLILNITFEPSCFDGVQNQDEQGIDCGGICPACAQIQMPARSCPDQVCLWGELFVCKADCALPSFLLLLLIYGLFFIPILYFEYHHYDDEHYGHKALIGTVLFYLLLTEISYWSITDIRQLQILFWGIIAVLTICVIALINGRN